MFYQLLVIVYLFGQCVAIELTDVVVTSSGPVKGEIVNSGFLMYAAFRGIRYAEKPTGGLRFKPPVPVQREREIQEATVEGNVCPQYDEIGRIVGSEDCLFLNVFTPAIVLREPPIILRPVMVWIHGGYFVKGSGSTATMRPDFLLEKGVVFVSFNYRLGILGFLNLNELGATGNQGLKDQNLVLQWVRTNIDKFGGDPGCVTIFGENAGAASVGFHILSKSSAGLFHRAISMSGTPLSPWAFQPRADAVRQGNALAKLLMEWSSCLKNKENALDVLAAVKVARLFEYIPQIGGNVQFTPTLEDLETSLDVFLAECSISKYETGVFSKVPLILGSAGQQTFPYRYRKKGIPGRYRNFAFLDNFADDMPFYFLQNSIRWLKEKIENETTEFAFADPVDETLELMLANNTMTPIFNYLMTSVDTSPRSLGDDGNPDGVEDANELALIFHIPSNNYDLSPDSPIRRVINKVTTLWTNFAKYGDPTMTEWGPPAVFWPSFDRFDQVLRIGYELELVSRPKIAFGQFTPKGSKSYLYDFADCSEGED